MRSFLFTIIIAAFIIMQSGCKDNSTEPEYQCDDIYENDTSGVVVRKPNIYIYPTKKIDLKVKIEFPSGGEVVESIPDYQEVWDVSVDTNGVIDEQYSFLYYECRVPNLFQKEKGWVIEKENLTDFFTKNLGDQGFSESEITDFVEYWIPLLHGSKYYAIYPQCEDNISKMINVGFSIAPDHFYRLYYFIQGISDSAMQLDNPECGVAIRSGYFALEWGAILN